MGSELVRSYRVIAVAIFIAVVLISASLFVVFYDSTRNSGPLVTSTSPCGSQGVYCGDFQIVSGNLTASGSSSVLDVTLKETGNMWIGSATVYVNGTAIGTPPASQYEPPGNIALNVQPGQQTTLVLTIPSLTISVQVGKSYSVLVYAWEGPPGERANAGSPDTMTITATSSATRSQTTSTCLATTTTASNNTVTPTQTSPCSTPPPIPLIVSTALPASRGSDRPVPAQNEVTFNTTNAAYVFLGDYAGVMLNVANGWSEAQSVVIFATFKSGTSVYVAAGTTTPGPGQTVPVFCLDLQTIPAGIYSVTFAAIATTDQVVSTVTTAITVVVP